MQGFSILVEFDLVLKYASSFFFFFESVYQIDVLVDYIILFQNTIRIICKTSQQFELVEFDLVLKYASSFFVFFESVY